MLVTTSADQMLSEDMGRLYADPLGFVMYAYEWDTDPTLQLVELPEAYQKKYQCKYGPDQWAIDLLEGIAIQVKQNNFDLKNAVDALQFATASGHGIGKSAITAWLVNWIMSTRPHSKGIVTANTYDQLHTKTWAEMAKWTKRCITRH